MWIFFDAKQIKDSSGLEHVGHSRLISLSVQKQKLQPLQYCNTVSIALFLSESHRIRADPVIIFSTGHQPCQR